MSGSTRSPMRADQYSAWPLYGHSDAVSVGTSRSSRTSSFGKYQRGGEPGLEQDVRTSGLGEHHAVDLDAHVPRRREDVDARVRAARVDDTPPRPPRTTRPSRASRTGSASRNSSIGDSAYCHAASTRSTSPTLIVKWLRVAAARRVRDGVGRHEQIGADVGDAGSSTPGSTGPPKTSTGCVVSATATPSTKARTRFCRSGSILTRPRCVSHALVVSTISRLHGQWCDTLFGTLPSTNRRTPVIPRLPTTTRSAPTCLGDVDERVGRVARARRGSRTSRPPPRPGARRARRPVRLSSSIPRFTSSDVEGRRARGRGLADLPGRHEPVRVHDVQCRAAHGRDLDRLGHGRATPSPIRRFRPR